MRWIAFGGMSLIVCSCSSSPMSATSSASATGTASSVSASAGASSSGTGSASASSAGASATGTASSTGTGGALSSSTSGGDTSSGGSSTGAPACPNPTFLLLPRTVVGGNPIGLAVADFNGDGRPDFAVTSYSDDSLTLFLNPGDGGIDGGLGAGVVYDAGAQPRRPAAANLTMAGGAPSLIVPDYQPASGVIGGPIAIFSNTGLWGNGGDGGFASPSEYYTPQLTCPESVAVVDLNQDGWPDLVFTDSCFRQLGVLMNLTGAGFGAPQMIGVTDDLNNLAIGDFNNDGWPDVVAVSASFNQIYLFTNSKDWSMGTMSGFATPVVYDDPGQPGGLAVADFNGDGWTDLAVVNLATTSVDFVGGSVGLFLNTGDGGLTPQVQFTGANLPQSVAVGDLNKDGLPDLVVAGDTGPAIYLNSGTWTNGGDGGFSGPFSPFADAGLGADAVSIVDYNGDGWLDIVMSFGVDAASAGVFINTCGQ